MTKCFAARYAFTDHMVGFHAFLCNLGIVVARVCVDRGKLL